ncbi:Uncharacterised protein [Macrococcoides caseolyticum]|nr:Uncharacterised protein [Macrococcus caseolyticus]
MNKKSASKKKGFKPQEQRQILKASEHNDEKPRNNMMLLTFITMMAVVWGLVYWLFIV